MIYVMNILTSTRKGDAYDMVAINKFPIIYKTGRAPEEFLEDQCMTDQIEKLIKNTATLEHAVLYIRSIKDDMTFEDYVFPVKKILESVNKNTENGKETQ